ncbi:MAG: hypothetical protein EAX90_08765 [Candidatus Heimdallarchaeota archaeon]|nr:hypothetical protein [Candidatus Heimdallarchaeota archaeon]
MDKKDKLFGGTIRFKELMLELTQNVSNLTDLVIKMIEKGIIALIEDNEELFKELQKDLVKVHDYYDMLDNSVVNSIALHHPFASDLRYILSSLKIGNEIHRCAHDAVHIAQSSEFVDRNNKMYNGTIEKIGDLAKLALKMFRESTNAFLQRKALDFKHWTKLDDEVDLLHDEIIIEIVKKMEKNKGWIQAGVSLILATRYIERIADHSCNIVEESTYVVTSKKGKIE